MTDHALIARVTKPGNGSEWSSAYERLHPGSHALVYIREGNFDEVAVGMRRAGFDFRDTIVVNLPGPIWRPALLFRKPIEESTVARQAVATGTGGINIDATRVKHANKADLDAHKAMVAALKAKGGSLGNSWKNTSDLSHANEVKEGGRWPGNLVLVHAPSCRRVATRSVPAPVINRFDDGMKPFGNGAGHEYTSVQTGDENGMEEVPVYECDPRCPIPHLDGLSGDRPSGGVTHQPNRSGFGFRSDRDSGTHVKRAPDAGGASRFFTQLDSDASLYGWFFRLVVPPEGTLVDWW